MRLGHHIDEKAAASETSSSTTALNFFISTRTQSQGRSIHQHMLVGCGNVPIGYNTHNKKNNNKVQQETNALSAHCCCGKRRPDIVCAAGRFIQP